VNPHATKTQIKAAIQEIFKVSIVKINTTNVGGKHKNFARRGVRTSGKMATGRKPSSPSPRVKRLNLAA